MVEFLQAKGYVKTRVCRLSYDSWVLDPDTVEESNNILNEDKDWLELCFTSVRRWKETDLNGRKRVWVNVYGVPLHAWCDQMFRRIGNKLGKVIEIDSTTSSRSVLSKGRIMVDTPYFETICRVFKFQIWQKTFEIHVVEKEGYLGRKSDDFASAAGDWSDGEVSESEVEVSVDESDDLSDLGSEERQCFNEDREKWSKEEAWEINNEMAVTVPHKR